jgi:hypothetical protein
MRNELWALKLFCAMQQWLVCCDTGQSSSLLPCFSSWFCWCLRLQDFLWWFCWIAGAIRLTICCVVHIVLSMQLALRSCCIHHEWPAATKKRTSQKPPFFALHFHCRMGGSTPRKTTHIRVWRAFQAVTSSERAATSWPCAKYLHLCCNVISASS